MHKISEKVTKDHLNEKMKNMDYKFAIMLVERQVETDEKIKKSDGTLKPRKMPRIDVLVLIDELKNEFEKINEMAREIARMNGRSIVSYEDAEDAIKLIKAQKSTKKGDLY